MEGPNCLIVEDPLLEEVDGPDCEGPGWWGVVCALLNREERFCLTSSSCSRSSSGEPPSVRLRLFLRDELDMGCVMSGFFFDGGEEVKPTEESFTG